MNLNTEQPNTFLEAWNALIQYKWRFVLASFGVMVGLLLGSFFMPKQYNTRAIFERHTDMVLTEIMNQGASRSIWDSQRSSLTQEISGQIAIEKTIKTLQSSEQFAHLLSGMNHSDLNKLRSEITRRVAINFNIGTKEFDRIHVSFVHSDPRLASAVVNTLVQNYIDRTRHLIDERLGKTAEFFQSEVDRNRRLSESLENKKLTFELENAELLPNFPGSIQLRLTETQKDLAKLLQEHDATTIEITSLQKLIAVTPKIIPQVVTAQNPELIELTEKKHEFIKQLSHYTNVRKMKPKHPDLFALREQIAAIEHQMANTPDEIVTHKRLSVNRKREDLEIRLTTAITTLQANEQQSKSVKDLVAQLSNHSSQLFPVRGEYRKINQLIAKIHNQQSFWESNLRRVQMALTAESGRRGISLVFVKPGKVSRIPIAPNLAQILMATVVMGLAAGSLNVFIAYRSNNAFHNGDQLVNAFKLPMIGSVSEVITRKEKRQRRVKNMIIYPLNASAMAAVLLVVVGLLYIDLEQPFIYDDIKSKSSTSMQHQRIAPAKTIGQE